MARDINKDIYENIIYKTRIKKYGLNLSIFLLLPSREYALPNVVIKYNNLYLYADFSQHLIFDYCLKVNHVYIPDEHVFGRTSIVPFNPILTSSELQEAYNVYYQTYISKEKPKDFPNPSPHTYDMLLDGFKFSKDWFQVYPYTYSPIQEPSYIVEIKTLYQNSRPLHLDVIDDIFAILQDLNCSKAVSHYLNSSAATWEIGESVFSQLPSQFTVNDVISIVGDEIRKNFEIKERLWYDIAEYQAKRKPIIIPIIYQEAREPKIIKIYKEELNNYGIYQGSIIEPTCRYNRNIYRELEVER